MLPAIMTEVFCGFSQSIQANQNSTSIALHSLFCSRVMVLKSHVQ